MTEEKFVESITSSRFRLCTEETDYSLFERDGIYLFVSGNCVSDALRTPSFSVPFSDIALIRIRRGFFEIETTGGLCYSLTADDEMEIGCMG